VTGYAFQVAAPTRPARDALLAYLTGLDEELGGVWKEARHARAGAQFSRLRAASAGQVAIAFEDGGLLRSLDAWQNALLPVAFHAAQELDVAAWRARGILAVFGHRPEDFAGRWEADLSLYERRLLGFVKAMLLEPQLLVIDRLFEDLGFEEQRSIAGWLGLFRSRYPLRRMLYVGLTEAAPGLLAGFAPLASMETVS
jgi:predicted ABC-type transport system involved in lysophospholipase L1 biosynthesis ATPase subunit